MKLIKESYIHNRIVFDKNEKELLSNTAKLISSLWQSNQNDDTDAYLEDTCLTIMNGISELLDNYSNEYMI